METPKTEPVELATPKTEPVELAWPPKTLVDAKEGEAVSPTETLVREESLVSTFITLEDPKEAAAAVPSPKLLLLLLSMLSSQETDLTEGPETVLLLLLAEETAGVAKKGDSVSPMETPVWEASLVK